MKRAALNVAHAMTACMDTPNRIPIGMTDYFAQSVEHCAAFLAEAIPAVRADMQSQNGPDDPEGFIETGFALSTAVRDREDLADIAALAIRRLAALTPPISEE